MTEYINLSPFHLDRASSPSSAAETALGSVNSDTSKEKVDDDSNAQTDSAEADVNRVKAKRTQTTTKQG